MSTKNPHSLTTGRDVSADKLLKSVFELFLKDLIEILNPELAPRLDLDHPTFLPRELFADFRKMGHREPDVAAEVLGRSGQSRAFTVHIEAENRFRTTMDERMTEYGMLFYLLRKQIVFSASVFLKGGPKGDQESAVEVREFKLEGEGWVMGRFYYAALYLGRSLAEEWIDRPQDLAPALAALMPSRQWDKVDHKLRCLARISRAGLDLRRQYVLGKVVDKYLELNHNEEERFTAELEREANKEIRDMAVTWEEALAESKAEGRAEGRAEGEAAGRAEGQIKGIQDGILLMAKSFWNEVPDEFAEKVRSIHDIDRLHAILERVPKVRSAAELVED